MNVITSLRALGFMVGSIKIFYPVEILKGKRVAIVGAADSAFKEANGDFINNFDLIIRVNKAPHSLTPDKFPYLGNRTDVLFHSFYENTTSGGGPIDFELYAKQQVKYLVNPYNYFSGLKTHFNYYKRNLNSKSTHILSRSYYKRMTNNFGKWIPTVGYAALYSVLHSKCNEVYITGFTFFKTPYMDDYRNQLKDMEANQKHINSQGLHNPDLELKEFIKQLDALQNTNTQILLDDSLSIIVKNNQ